MLILVYNVIKQTFGGYHNLNSQSILIHLDFVFF